eukprot:jgi/Picre1/31850/NNA_007199.t1
MDSEGRYLSCNSRLLGIIPGPKEPKDLNPFLCFIGEEFERLRSSTMSYEYQECDESGEAIKYSGTHRPVLGFIYADAKAREKVHLCFPGMLSKALFLLAACLTSSGTRRRDVSQATISRLCGE